MIGAEAVDAAFAEHMKTLFASFIRHAANVEGARQQFRKDLTVARMAHAEMSQIVEEMGV